MADVCAIMALSPGAKRSSSAAQLASSDAGATSRLGRRLPSWTRPQHEQQREHLDGLAKAHVIGEAGAEAEPGKQVEPADTDLLVWPKGAVQLTAGIKLFELLGRAQPLEGLGEPRPRDDARPFGIGAGRGCVPG